MQSQTASLPSKTARRFRPAGPHYKWGVLSNTTLGILMATINASLVLISLPAIFNGIGINPLAPGETNYMLWMILSYMVMSAALVVSLGRISDMFGRVRLYNLGFAIFTLGSVLLFLTPGSGNTAATEMIIGLTIVMIGLTYGLQPYGTDAMGWGSPFVITALTVGVVLLVLFAWVETRVKEPMFHLTLFKIRLFSAGNIANLLASLARGGLQFMLILWLQGVWLPLHGYSFADTPLWAGIYMLPLMVGFIVMGPLIGVLSDRFGQRLFAVMGMILQVVSFLLLTFLPVNFDYLWFAPILAVMGLGQGMFSVPNAALVMNSVPAEQRG